MKIKKIFPNKFMWVVLGVTFGLLALSINLWSERLFVVKFQTNLQKDTLYQVFYTRKETDLFNVNMSIRKLVKAGRHEVEIDLPIHKVAKFRLDFGISPGKVEISDLQLRGRSVVKFDDFSKFSFRNIDKPKMEKNKLSFDCDHRDPYIIYKDKLALEAGRCIDFYALIILATLYFLIAYKVVRYLSHFKIEEHHSRIDIVFLAVFFVLLFVPMFHISDAEKSIQENRMLAKKPDFSQIYDKGGNFGKLYEQWFNDRFFGRKVLIDVNNYSKCLFGETCSNIKIIVGKDGWLFSKLFSSEKMYMNANLFSDKELDILGKQVLQFYDKLKKEGVKEVYFYLSNDKESLYYEFYPESYVKQNDVSRLEQVLVYLNKNYPGIKVLNFYDELSQHKKEGDILFSRVGTHMNDLGSFYEYYYMLREIKKDFPILSVLKLEDFSFEDTYDCDKDIYKAGNVFNYSEKNLLNTHLTLRNRSKNIIKKVVAKKSYNTVLLFKNENQQNDLDLFIIGDSFHLRYLNYLVESFSSVYSVFWGNGKSLSFSADDVDYILKNKPDIVIVETTERFLQRLLNLQFPKD